MNLQQRKNKIIFIIFIIIVAGFVLSGFKSSKKSTEDKISKLTVTTTLAKLENIQDKVELTGTVLPEEEVKISPKTSGNIDAIYIDSGRYVNAGQALAKIDYSDLVISRQSAAAQLSEASAQAHMTFNKSRKQEIGQAEDSIQLAKAGVEVSRASLKMAEANLKKAQKDKERFAVLYHQGAISALDYDNAVTNYEVAYSQSNKARADLMSAQANYSRTQNTSSLTFEGSRYEEKSIARARVEMAKANLDSTRKEIADSIIRSPISGYIVKRNIKLGSRVRPDDVAFILVKHNKLELEASAAESDIYKLKIGQKVEITSNINPAFKLVGSVKKIEPYIDPQTRIGTVKISLPSSKEINYGMFLNGTVYISNKNSVVIPEEAMLFRNNKNIVFKIDNNNLAHEAEVKPGTREKGFVEIITGLNPGEKIVLDGAGFLFDGDKVVDSNSIK